MAIQDFQNALARYMREYPARLGMAHLAPSDSPFNIGGKASAQQSDRQMGWLRGMQEMNQFADLDTKAAMAEALRSRSAAEAEMMRARAEGMKGGSPDFYGGGGAPSYVAPQFGSVDTAPPDWKRMSYARTGGGRNRNVLAELMGR